MHIVCNATFAFLGVYLNLLLERPGGAEPRMDRSESKPFSCRQSNKRNSPML